MFVPELNEVYRPLPGDIILERQGDAKPRRIVSMSVDYPSGYAVTEPEDGNGRFSRIRLDNLCARYRLIRRPDTSKEVVKDPSTEEAALEDDKSARQVRGES